MLLQLLEIKNIHATIAVLSMLFKILLSNCTYVGISTNMKHVYATNHIFRQSQKKHHSHVEVEYM